LHSGGEFVLQIAIGDRAWTFVDVAESAAAIDGNELEMTAYKIRLVGRSGRG
jgi:hypothetical protein